MNNNILGKRVFMVNPAKFLCGCLILLTNALLMPFAHSGEPIIIGQSAAMTGPAAMLGSEMARGMNAYFNQVNNNGGVNGHVIKLISMDDGYEPVRTIQNTNKLINEEKVVALIGYVGTPTSAAIFPQIKASGLPFIGAYTGANSLRDGKISTIYNIRASYSDEALKIVKEINGMGLHTVGIVYQKDAFGAAGLEAMQAAVAKYPDMKIVWTETVDRNSEQVLAAAEKIRANKVDTVFVVTAYKTESALLIKARKEGYLGLISTLSFVGTEPLALLSGPAARGVIVPAVIPSPHSETTSLCREYHRAIQEDSKSSTYSYASMEGYIAAKVFVEAVKNIKGAITADAINKALSKLQVDLGGFVVDFKNSNNGSTWVETTIIADNGKIKR